MRSKLVRGGLAAALVIGGGFVLAATVERPARAEGAQKIRMLAPTEASSTQLVQANACNPCAGANPCVGGNPCGSNPCGGGNPCAGARIDPARFQQPSGVSLASGERAALVAEGERLWNDPSIGNSGLSCGNCHVQGYALMKASFAEPYPHHVEMADQRAGVKKVNAAEMVNFCMLVPMAAEPLPWTSRELAALTAYVEHLQPGYRPVGGGGGANPCNPCAGANPCAGRNPCGDR